MAVANPPVSSVKDNPISPWWVTLLSGIALVFIGIMLWTRPALTTLIVVQIMGWFFLFEGILNIIMIFVDRRGWGWNLFMGIVGIIAGLWIVQNPIAGGVAALVAIVIVLGVQALMIGAVMLVASFQGAGFGAAILGIVNIILGGLLLFTNPLATALVVPWVYGIFAVVGGVATIVGAFMQRSQQKKVVAA